MNSLSVLVADDNDAMRTVLQIWLETAGYRVTTVASGNHARVELIKGGFDALITDIEMSDGNGLNVIAALREFGSRIPVIAISGGGFDRNAGTCLEAAHDIGADALLMKPFSVHQLFAVLQSTVRRKTVLVGE